MRTTLRITALAALVACALVARAEDDADRKAFATPLDAETAGGNTLRIPAPDDAVTVLFFLSSDCPVANKYAPEIRRISARFGKENVLFLRVYGDGYHDLEDVQKHTEEYDYTIPAILDDAQEIVVRSGARVTPEAVVLKADGDIAYRGRIDDRYVDFGRYRQKAKDHDLIDAITAVLAGEAVPHPRTKAIGCFITVPPASEEE